MYRIIGSDGKEYGPVGGDQLRQWLAQGRANGRTRVRAEGSAEWQPLKDFPELAAALGASGGGAAPSASGPWAPPCAPLVAVPNYLTRAILVTIFCCLPFGIPAIVYASQVNGKLQAGDSAGAQESSRKARLWCWWSVSSYLGLIAIYAAVMGVLSATGRLE